MPVSVPHRASAPHRLGYNAKDNDDDVSVLEKQKEQAVFPSLRLDGTGSKSEKLLVRR